MATANKVHYSKFLYVEVPEAFVELRQNGYSKSITCLAQNKSLMIGLCVSIIHKQSTCIISTCTAMDMPKHFKMHIIFVAR